jgi:putative redox protein
MVEIDVVYQGGLRCEATHGPSGEKLISDAPVDNHGKGESFSPTDLCATALGVCMPTVMGIFAERHQIDLVGLKVSVKKHMSADLPRRISKLEVELDMPITEDHPQRAALEKIALTCPVHESLAAGIEIPVNFRYTG